MFRLGLLVNPCAGLGGAVGLKGSDGAETVAEARARGAVGRAEERALRCLKGLGAPERIEVMAWGGAMGADAARRAGFSPQVVGAPDAAATTADDTRQAAATLAELAPDLLLFVGGDGTARDLVTGLAGRRQAVLGVPAGVKMHSGVFAVNPEAAARIIDAMMAGELVTLEDAEVRDIDEEAFRRGEVRTRHYGELRVPAAPRWVQATKIGGRESEPLVLEEIAAGVAQIMAQDPGDSWVIGPGSTTAAVMAHLGLPNTLLGVDLVRDGALIASDLTATELLEQVAGRRTRLLVTAIGGQGHVFGRGNQQLTPQLIRQVGAEGMLIVATRTKLAALEGRPLRLDTGDPRLDQELSGFVPVLTGFEDRVLYRLGDEV
jgi:predicted polyphosphate/ATP-dependent NAD kinase